MIEAAAAAFSGLVILTFALGFGQGVGSERANRVDTERLHRQNESER